MIKVYSRGNDDLMNVFKLGKRFYCKSKAINNGALRNVSC